MKGALALHLCIAVMAAFCDAPFVHFHLEGSTEHAREAHYGKNLGGHHHGATAFQGAGLQIGALEGSDEDAVFLTWFQSGAQTKPIAATALPVFAALMAPSIAVAGPVTAAVPRSHDPPDQPSVRPRSPPPFESLPTV